MIGRLLLRYWRFQYAHPGLPSLGCAAGWALVLMLVVLAAWLTMAVPDQGLLVKGF